MTLATPSSTTRRKCGRYTSCSARGADGDVDREPRVLHRVAREVLHARVHVLLHPARERRAHLAEQVRILAVRLLGATPGGVAEQVHAHAAEVRRADGAGLEPDDAPDRLLEREVERRATRHRHREAVALPTTTPRGPSVNANPGCRAGRCGRRLGVAVVAAARMSVRPGQKGMSPSRRPSTSSRRASPTSAPASAWASARRAPAPRRRRTRSSRRGAQRRLPKYFLYGSADAASSGSASSFGCIFSHAASRLAGKYSVGQ